MKTEASSELATCWAFDNCMETFPNRTKQSPPGSWPAQNLYRKAKVLFVCLCECFPADKLILEFLELVFSCRTGVIKRFLSVTHSRKVWDFSAEWGQNEKINWVNGTVSIQYVGKKCKTISQAFNTKIWQATYSKLAGQSKSFNQRSSQEAHVNSRGAAEIDRWENLDSPNLAVIEERQDRGHCWKKAIRSLPQAMKGTQQRCPGQMRPKLNLWAFMQNCTLIWKHNPSCKTWWWQHHAVGTLFSCREREAAQSWWKDGWM